MNKTRRGFTLIELLVVIAIIGILSSIILASLNTARGKGNDAKVKEQVANARSAAEIYNDTNGTYGPSSTTCTSGIFADTASGMSSLTAVANYPAGTALTCTSVATAYAITASLSTANTYACVDSTGNSTTTTSTTNATNTSNPHC